MSGEGDCLPKNPWKKAIAQDEVNSEPIVSLVEIMSEELATSLAEDGEHRDHAYALSLACGEQQFDNDEDLARALQAEFDRENELMERLEHDKQSGSKTVHLAPQKYTPRSKQESDDEPESDEDDDDVREMATAMLYAKLDEAHQSPLLRRDENGEVISKHDSTTCGRRNADKSLNDNVGIRTGDMSSAKISNKVYNTLRNFSKVEVKRQHRLKDKEEKATMETSVDAKTRMSLFKWINQGVFDRVYGIIATGKESAVLQAVQGAHDDNHFAIKVYKTTLSEFKNRGEYVKDDFRFKNPRGVLKIWAEREFMNLKRMTNCGLPCPEPIRIKKNVLAMSFIGEAGEAAPRLRNVDWDFFTEEERKEIFDQVHSIICRMYKECKLVHGDLSEFNLLLLNGQVFVIDVSQAMDISHPRHLYYLTRDIENVLDFFASIGTSGLPSAVSLFNAVTDLDMAEGDNLTVQIMSNRTPVKHGLLDKDQDEAELPEKTRPITESEQQETSKKNLETNENSTSKDIEVANASSDINGLDQSVNVEIKKANGNPNVTKDVDTEDTSEIIKEKSAESSKKEEQSIYDFFTDFDTLAEDFSLNIGTFGVYSCIHVPYGENVHLSSPVTNFTFIDAKKRKGWFCVYGNNAVNWKDLKPDQVVFIENFNWRKDYKNKSHFYGVSFDRCGSLNDDSILMIKQELSERYSDERGREVDHVHSLVEIKAQCERIVLHLDTKLPKKTVLRHTDNSNLTLRTCLFSTSDRVSVEITAFDKEIKKIDILEEQKVYIIETLKIPATFAHASSNVVFNVGHHTTFQLTDMKLEPITAVQASLKDLAKADKSKVYESQFIVRQESGKCKDHYQGVVFDYDKTRAMQLTAIITFKDNIQLHRGQKINFKYHIGENFGKKVLNVVSGSLEISEDLFTEDEIDTLKFEFV